MDWGWEARGMDGQACFDLDLLIEPLGEPLGEKYRARVLRSPAGDGQTTVFERPFSGRELENFVLTIGATLGRTRRPAAAPVAAAKQFGGRLYRAVFTGPVGECLRRSADRAQAENKTLRIRLRLIDSPELAELPWEFLYDAADDWFIALSDATPVVRYVQLPAQPRPVLVTLPLRILVIKSEPVNRAALDLAGEWARVEEALADLVAAGAVTFTHLTVPTLSELRRALLREQFQVLHYLGHGAFTEQDGGYLMFTDHAGRSVPVTGEQLSVMLKDHTSLRLAILNACEAGRTDPAKPFRGIADTLVRRGIPAVIAMQFEVSDIAAVEFAPALYGALAAGRAVDAAVSEARKAMYAVSPLEWATPVLHLRADDARLFDIGQQAPAVDHLADGDRQLSGRQWAQAEAAYRRAVAASPRSVRAQAGLGTTLERQNRLSEAEAAYRAALGAGQDSPGQDSPGQDSPGPDSSAARTGLASLLWRRRRFPAAEAAAREAIAVSSGYAPAHAMLGLVLSDQGRAAEAEAACLEALRLDPASARARALLGTVRSDQGRHSEAEAACREAIRLDRDLPEAHCYLSIVLFSAGRPAEAESAAREAIRLDPYYLTARLNLAAVLREQGRGGESEAAYRDCFAVAPEIARPHQSLADLLFRQGEFTEAEVQLREAVRLEPDNADTRLALGHLLYQQERYADAAAEYRVAAGLERGNADAHGWLAMSLRNARRPAEAEPECREAVRLDPGSARWQDGLGLVLSDLGRYREAEGPAREAARLSPDDARIAKNLASTLSKLQPPPGRPTA
jgi:tetratricopeptide (TPR) repeat protein